MGSSEAAACQHLAALPCWSTLRAGLKPSLESSPSAMSRSSRQGASMRGSTASQQAGAAASDRAGADACQAGVGTPAEWSRMQTELQQLQVRPASAPGACLCQQDAACSQSLVPCLHFELPTASCEPLCCDKDAAGMRKHQCVVCRSSTQCCWGS